MACPTEMTASPTDTMTTMDLESMKKKLFEIAMKGEWDEVVTIYRENASVHGAKITRSGDTALHIAVSDVQEDTVEKLVGLICDPKNTLKIENERGNTPLHFAASMGNVRMCNCIAQVDPELMDARNIDGETPIFLAALHGRKDAFLCLDNICGINKNYTNCRRKDGDTILHCAIIGEYFDLAYQIILRYRDLVNSVNEQGFTPLHLLASKPSAFKSGSHLSWWSSIIYPCIFVDDLKEESLPKISKDEKIFVDDLKEEPLPKISKDEKDKDEKKPNYPENYHTCINFSRLLWTIIQQLWNMIQGETTRQAGDAENPSLKTEANTAGNEENPRAKTKSTREENPTAKDRAQRSTNGPQGFQPANGPQGHQLYPSNYDTCFEIIKLVSKAMLVIFGLGSREISKLQNKKQKHTWSVQIMNLLLARSSMYKVEDEGKDPHSSRPETDKIYKPDDEEQHGGEGDQQGQQISKPDDKEQHGEVTESDLKPKSELKLTASGDWLYQAGSGGPWVRLPNGNIEKKILNLGILAEEKKSLDVTKKETAILIAAKNGVKEMVERILQIYPVAIHDMNSDKKNIVLLAVENRQPHVYQHLVDRNILKDSVFHKVDGNGNSALHLAAMLGEYRPWLIPGAALQMQWEIKWYEFVKNSMPAHFFVRYNKEGKTPKNIFTETHKDLVKMGGEWLNSTSNSCSVVAALIATVAFATSTTVPGGIKEGIGTPTLEDKPAFNVFAISSLIALCFSVTALVMFLSILTSRYQERDFGSDLPRKLLVGLTSLFISIASMLLSFCAGHFFVLKDKLKYAAFPIYAVTCLPVTFFAVAQFPLYFDLIWATFKKVPQRSYQVIPL